MIEPLWKDVKFNRSEVPKWSWDFIAIKESISWQNALLLVRNSSAGDQSFSNTWRWKRWGKVI